MNTFCTEIVQLFPHLLQFHCDLSSDTWQYLAIYKSSDNLLKLQSAFGILLAQWEWKQLEAAKGNKL